MTEQINKIENLTQPSCSKALNDICYEQIKDNFYYGKFGDVNLVIDKNIGYFNATKLCADGGKMFKNWTRLDRAEELIAFYKQENKSHRSEMSGGFYEIKADNKNILNKKITGQYVQKEFILDIASWISPAFYFKCSKIVNNYFINQFKKQIEEKDRAFEKIKEQLQNAEERALNFQQLAISDIHLEQTQII